MPNHILIIGGGATGTGIARDLAMRGFDVTLAEKNELGSGTSGKSHGLLHSGARYAEDDYHGAKECIEENEILKEIAGECIRNTEGVFVQLEDDNPEYFDEKKNACEEIGINVKLLNKKEITKQIPYISNSVVRAMKIPDAVIYPSRLIALNAQSAEQNGANIHINTPIKNINVHDDEISSVELGGETNKTIYPDYVVNATGPWSGKVADLVDIDINMAPSKGVMVALEYEELDTVINRCRSPSDGDIIIPHEKQVVLGTTSVPVSDPEDFPKEEKEVDICIEECSKMVPNIEEKNIERVWWGVRPLYSPEEAGKNRRNISRGFHLLEHYDESVQNMISVVGGKLTTYRKMAESTSDYVCEEFSINKECKTHIKSLPHKNNTKKINDVVNKFGGYNKTDKNIGE